MTISRRKRAIRWKRRLAESHRRAVDEKTDARWTEEDVSFIWGDVTTNEHPQDEDDEE